MKATFRSELRALLTILKGIAFMVFGLWAVQQVIWLLAVSSGGN